MTICGSNASKVSVPAEPIGPKRFRLSGLLRGCRGTEWTMNSHASGEDFVLIVPGTLQEIALPPLAIGTSISIRARGLADGEATPIQRIVTGEAMRPPSPVDLFVQVMPDGDLQAVWTRRSRLGWLWPDDADVPLGESSERYRVTVIGSAGTLTFDAFEPQIVIPAQALTGMTGMVTMTVVQIGDFAQSRPATATLMI